MSTQAIIRGQGTARKRARHKWLVVSDIHHTKWANPFLSASTPYLESSIFWNIASSRSRKMSIADIRSLILSCTPGTHCNNRRHSLTAISSAGFNFPACRSTSILCILSLACSQTPKTVAEISGFSCIARASWAASSGLAA